MANPHVIATCLENKVSLKDFFGPLRSRHILAARRAAILRLRSLGLSYRACGRIIGRDHTMVRYWMRDGVRERKRETMRARKAAKIPEISPHRDADNTLLSQYEVVA